METDVVNLAGKGVLHVELGTLVVFLLLVLWSIYDTFKQRRLSLVSLCAIAGLSIFWQEYYADWGAYLLWSDEFHMMPWGSTLWTTPRKPWHTLVAYPVFMTIAIGLMLQLCRQAQIRFIKINSQLVCFTVAAICLIVINTVLEYLAVASAGQWTYVDTMGPVLSTAHGDQPLLYPNIPFGIWGGVICCLILSVGIDGTPKFEAYFGVQYRKAVWAREGLRALSWITVWNITYWIFLCTPLILLRELMGAPNLLVP